jgi:hypothetical protein
MDPVIDKLLTIFAPIITVIVASASTVVSVLLSRYVTLMKVKQSIANGQVAVRAIEQLYPDLPGVVKKDLALKFAQTLNADSNIKLPDATAVQINESHVNNLPPTPPQTPPCPPLSTPPAVPPPEQIIPLG